MDNDEAREPKRYTDEEFYEYLDNNDVKAELIDGFIIVDMGQPNIMHQELAFEFKYAFREYFRRHNKKCRAFMENEVRFDKDNVVVPDVFVTCKPENVDDKRMNGAPEFIIEIVSGNRFSDYARKLSLYKEQGVREYWIVDPKKEQVTVWFFEDEGSPYFYKFDEEITVRMTEGSEPLIINIKALLAPDNT